MVTFGAVRIALRALRVNTLRSILTMLGIIIGVAAVITMIAIGSGAQSQVNEQIKALGTNLVIVMPGYVRVAGVRMGSGSRVTLTEDDALAMQQEIVSVQAAAPILRGTVHVVAAGSNWSTTFFGVTPEYFEARDWGASSGKLFDASAVAGTEKVVLLGDTVARMLFGGGDAVGQVIRVDKVPMQVIGVLERKGQSTLGQDQDDLVLMPISTARKRIFGINHVKMRSVGPTLVKIREGVEVPHAQEEIRTLLRQRHRLQPEQEDDFTLRTLADVTGAREESSRVMSLLLAALASVSLLVGGIGIMNIMLVSVTERTREIGLRMAVGARARDILSQFLVEAMTLAVLGGLCGILLGFIGSYGIGQFAGWRMEVSVAAMALAVSFAAAVGILFGFYPARKASLLTPIDALRFE